jgi:hypothetical protein
MRPIQRVEVREGPSPEGHAARAEAQAEGRAKAELAAADAVALQSRLDVLRAAHEEQSTALARARAQLADAAADSSTSKTRLQERDAAAGAVEGRLAHLEELLVGAGLGPHAGVRTPYSETRKSQIPRSQIGKPYTAVLHRVCLRTLNLER